MTGTSHSNDSPQVPSDTPAWIEEVRKEIHRLNNKIARMQRLADRDEMTSEHIDDLNNWIGWRDALRWVLRMREGKSTRQEIWGRS